MATSTLQFLLALAVILLSAKLGAALSVRLGQPGVLGELLAGVLLGPTVVDLLHLMSDPVVAELVHHLAELGVVVLMFLAGLETELDDLNRARLASMLAGSLGVVVPIAMAVPAGLAFGFGAETAIFLGLVLAATSVSISARTLMELGVLQRKEGVAILGAAVVDDVLAILTLSVFLALAGGAAEGGAVAVVGAFGRMFGYFLVAGLAGYLLLPRLGRWAERLPVSESVTAIALVVMLAFAWLAEAVGGVALITGAFLAGLLFARTEVRHTLAERTHVLAYGLLAPVFFINIGMTANLRSFSGADILLLVALTIVAVASKVIGCGIGARLARFSWRESLRVGAGMVSRGEVGLIIASLGVSSQIIDGELFSVFVVVVLLTTLITPPVLKLVFADSTRSMGRG